MIRTISGIISSDGSDVALCKTDTDESTDVSKGKTEDTATATHSGDSSGAPAQVVTEPRLVQLYRLLHFGHQQALDIARAFTGETLTSNMATLIIKARTLRDDLRGTMLRGKFSGALNRLTAYYTFCKPPPVSCTLPLS